MNNKNILITGASGLVGSALVSQLKKYNLFTPSSSQLNLLNFNSLNQYLQKNNIQIIIHLAANVGGLFKNMNYKVNMFEDNILMNINVLKAAHLNNIEKVISCLSTCIFPDNIKYPINEDDLQKGPPHFSNDAYAYAKRMLEVQSKAYREQYGSNFVCIIPTNIYGPYDNYNLEDSHVIPALIHKSYIAKRENKKLMVKGSGKPLRQFIYSEDLAKLIEVILLHYNNAEPIILSVGEEDECSIGEVAEIIAKNNNIEIEYDIKGADGQYKKTADNKKLVDLLKKLEIDFQFTPIEKGLIKSIEWFNNNYENARK